jgi:hypothetical protein
LIDHYTNSETTPKRRLKVLDPKALEEMQSLREEISQLKKDLDLYKNELFHAESERDLLKEASFNIPSSERTISDGRLQRQIIDLKAIIQQLTIERDAAVSRQLYHQDHIRMNDSSLSWDQHPLASSRLSGSLTNSMNQSLRFDN